MKEVTLFITGAVAVVCFMFEIIGYTIIGFWYNPFTDRGFHTVVKTYRYSENPWNHTKTVSITGTIWHDMNVMSQKEIGHQEIVFCQVDKNKMDSVINVAEKEYYHIGDSIIKLQNE